MSSTGWLQGARSAGRVLVRGLVQLFYPNTCWICGAALAEEQRGFCAGCRALLLSDRQPACARCAATVGPFLDTADGCGHCRAERFAFDAVIRLGTYDMLRDVILRLKNVHGEGLAEELGRFWGEQARSRLRQVRPDVIVPVPLHWWRQWRRGYNQSHALARGLAPWLETPCRPRWLRRIRNTPGQQPGQAALLRKKNVRGAFHVPAGLNLQGQTILLVDDVLTSGSTAHEAARALRLARAARIVVAVLGRASP